MRIACAICGGALGRELLVITQPDRFERHVGIAEGGYRRAWVECEGCGTATDILPPGPNRLAEIEQAYYAIDLKNSSIAEKFAKVMGLPRARSDNAFRVDRVVDFATHWPPLAALDGSKRALDIGAGMGVFLAAFMDRAGNGWSMTAVEPDPLAAAHMRGLGTFGVIEGSLPVKQDIGQFHLVTLNKVVEHLADPVAMLRNVAPLLDSAGGVAYIEVPDKQTIRYRPPEDNILGALHRHLYGLRGLLRLVTEAGFAPLRIERIVEPSGKLSVFAFVTTPAVAARMSSTPSGEEFERRNTD
jgi:SAM-dependent methyltransferase